MNRMNQSNPLYLDGSRTDVKWNPESINSPARQKKHSTYYGMDMDPVERTLKTNGTYSYSYNMIFRHHTVRVTHGKQEIAQAQQLVDVVARRCSNHDGSEY
jgi:hypothetical protein